jgi:hypothetical protein
MSDTLTSDKKKLFLALAAAAGALIIGFGIYKLSQPSEH